jgi:hypothetical protein
MLDFALLVQGNFVIFKLVNIFPFLLLSINQQNKHAFELIPGQYCLVFLHDLLLTALLAGKQLYKNHMVMLFQTPRALVYHLWGRDVLVSCHYCYENVPSPLVFFFIGAECWPTKRRHVQQLSVAEMRMLRWCCGHTGGIESGTTIFGIGLGWHQLRRN